MIYTIQTIKDKDYVKADFKSGFRKIWERK